MQNSKIVLASSSPRRRELLGIFGLPFDCIPAVGEEKTEGYASCEALTEGLARQKALEVAAKADRDAVVIGSDTLVELDGVKLGKPGSEEDAFRMLRALSGRTHRVCTGLCCVKGDTVLSGVEITEVVFRELSDEEIYAYIATGEPMDKAGAYGIQGRASLFVEGIRGDYFTVMGLPLCRLGTMLKELGVKLL